ASPRGSYRSGAFGFFAASAAFSSALRCCGVLRGGAAMSSMVPPAFSIFSRADALTLCARTVIGFVSSPSPRIFRPSRWSFSLPEATSDSSVTGSFVSRRCRSLTLTTAYSTRNGFEKPRFGMRRWMGICLPSNPTKFMLPVRAFCPLPPRPAVLPVPLAWPRPTLFRSFTPPPRGGVNLLSSFMVFLLTQRFAARRRSLRRVPLFLGAGSPAERLEGVGRLLHRDQVGDLRDHSADGGRVLEDALAADSRQPEAAHRGAVVFGVAAQASDELHA